VTVTWSDGVRGLLLQGRRKSSGAPAAVGQFIDVDQTSPAATTVQCGDGPDDTLVAWYGDGQADDRRSYTWMPPDGSSDGPLQLVYVLLNSCTCTCRMMDWLSQAFNARIFARTCPICS